MRFKEVVTHQGGPIEIYGGRNFGKAAWLGENEEDERPPLSACQPNAFQWDLMRKALGGLNLLGVWGGLGCGKSTGLAMLAKLIAETRPGCGGYFVMTTYGDLMATAYQNLLSVLGHPWRAIKSERKFIHPETGSWIALAYYDVKSTQHEGQNPIEGRNAHWAIVDEAQKWSDDMVLRHLNDRCRESAWDATRTREYNPIIIINGRPSSVDWWPRAINEAGRKAREAAEAEGREPSIATEVMYVKSYANLKNLGMDYIERQRAVRTEAEFKSLLEGELMEQSDLILSDWLCWNSKGKPVSWPDGNHLDGFEYDPDLPTVISVDPGFGFPAATVWQTVEREHPKYGPITLHVLCDVIVGDHITTPSLLDMIRDKYWPRKYDWCAPVGVDGRFDMVVIDALGGQGNNRHTGISDIELVSKPPPGASDVDFMGGGLGYYPEYGTDVITTGVALGVTRMQRLIRSATGVRRIVIAPELAKRERDVDPTERGWNHTVKGYRFEKNGKKPKKGGQGDPSGVADTVRMYVQNCVPDESAFAAVGRTDDLDLSSVPTRLESLPLDER